MWYKIGSQTYKCWLQRWGGTYRCIHMLSEALSAGLFVIHPLRLLARSVTSCRASRKVAKSQSTATSFVKLQADDPQKNRCPGRSRNLSYGRPSIVQPPYVTFVHTGLG